MEKADTDSETEAYAALDEELKNDPYASEGDAKEEPVQKEAVKAKPKPNRRKVRSEAQIKAFEKAKATRRANLEKKKQEKLAAQHKAYLASQKSNEIVDDEPLPKTERKKARKKKVVYVDESDSSSEEEVIVRRKKKRQPRPQTPKAETAPAPAPAPEPVKQDYFQFI